MKKSFKRSIAVLLSVLMVACSMPFTALAGEYKPDIQLQFGTFFDTENENASVLDGASYTGDYSISGIEGPAVEYKNNALVLSADTFAEWNSQYDDYFVPVESDYTYKTGDRFTVSVRLDNISKISAFEAAISYSANIAPLSEESDWGFDGALPLVGQDTAIDGLNDGDLGNLSFVDTDKKVIVASASVQNNENYVEVDGSAIIATFAFEIIGEGDITFGVYKATEDSDVTYDGAFYIADASEGTGVENQTTYQPVDEAVGSQDMTFMSKNEYNAPSKVTITFVDAAGQSTTIECDPDATYDVPNLPETVKAQTTHTTYAWDVVPTGVATADATYTVVPTTAEHKYGEKEVVKDPTCKDKGTSRYTCTVCSYSFEANDINPTTTHTPGEAVEENVVKATCSKAGSYDLVTYCKVCGAKISTQHVDVEKTEHKYGEWIYNGDASYDPVTKAAADGTESRTCASCGDKQTQTVSGTRLLRVRGTSLSLASSLTVNFQVRTSTIKSYFNGGVDKLYCKVTHEGSLGTTIIEDCTVYGSGTSQSYQFAYAGVNPQCINDTFKVTFYAENDGKLYYGPEVTYNIAQDYIVGTLADTKDEKLKKVLVELLYYSEAVQKVQTYKTNVPMSSLLTEEQKAIHSTAAMSYEDILNAEYKTYETKTNRFSSVGLTFGSTVQLWARMNIPDIDGYVVKVQVANGPVKEYTKQDNPELFSQYSTKTTEFHFEELNANQLRSPIYLTVYNADGVPVTNTLRYSAESQVAANYASSSNDWKALYDGAMRYGDAAKAFAG